MLVLDVSGSMAANDVQPTRFAAAKAIVQRFLAKAPTGYRVALVTFSDHVAVSAAPTHSIDAVSRRARACAHGPAGNRARRRGRPRRARCLAVHGSVAGHRPPAAVVVLSDGGQTTGRVSPQQAAAEGAAGAHPRVGDPARDSGRGRPAEAEGRLHRAHPGARAAAGARGAWRGSAGRFTGGAAAVDVKGTYDELGSRTGTRRKTIEVSAAAAGGGLAFVLAGGLLSGLWFRRIP